VPRLTLEPHDESIVEIDLGPKVPPRLIALAWHRDRYRTPAAEAFVETALQVCADLQPETAAAA
jgi:DNA-binding transcriptional LysR family regulator